MANKETRTRGWTIIIYPESAPSNWRDIIILFIYESVNPFSFISFIFKIQISSIAVRPKEFNFFVNESDKFNLFIFSFVDIIFSSPKKKRVAQLDLRLKLLVVFVLYHF